MTEEVSILEGQISESSGITQESDSIATRLNEMLSRLGWRTSATDKELMADELVRSASELASLAQQSAKIDWAQTPVTIGALNSYCDDAAIRRDKCARDILNFDQGQKAIGRLNEALQRAREAMGLLQEAERFVDSGLALRLAELEKERNTIATHSGWLAGMDDDAMVLSSNHGEMTVTAFAQAAKSGRATAQDAVAAADAEYAAFSKLRDDSANLAQQLRQIATELLHVTPVHDECPLCHTKFQENELELRISMGVDASFEKAGQDLLNKVRERNEALRSASSSETAANWLAQFRARANLPDSVTVNTAIEAVDHARRSLTAAREKSDALDSEIRGLSAHGLSLSRMEEIGLGLRTLGHPVEQWSIHVIQAIISKVAAELANDSRTLETQTQQTADVERSLKSTLGLTGGHSDGVQALLSTLNERLAITDTLRTKLADFAASFPWPPEKSLAELSVEAELIRGVAGELQVAIGREQKAKTAHAEATKRRDELQKRLTELDKRLTRFEEAYSVLDSLRREYSLKKAMESSLQQNRSGIEDIFAHIHSPAEFSGLSSSWTTLLRAADRSEAKLSEISTGQRSAFALSIFLAQNAQLTAGPPVILIDDPIAHVDDLNCLSFLDYLREIALTGRRQIFFATANDKLATLFERKFDFLGQKFQRFNLRRDAAELIV